MRITIEDIKSGEIVLTIEEVTGFDESVFPKCGLVATKTKNYIIEIQPGQMMVIHKDD